MGRRSASERSAASRIPQLASAAAATGAMAGRQPEISTSTTRRSPITRPHTRAAASSTDPSTGLRRVPEEGDGDLEHDRWQQHRRWLTGGPQRYLFATPPAASRRGGYSNLGDLILNYALVEEPGGTTYIDDPSGSSIIGEDPDLAALADNGGATYTHEPSSISPAIDKASITRLLATSAVSCVGLISSRSITRQAIRPTSAHSSARTRFRAICGPCARAKFRTTARSPSPPHRLRSRAQAPVSQ